MSLQSMSVAAPPVLLRERICCRFCTAMWFCYVACFFGAVFMLLSTLAMAVWFLVF